jgi:hypothetical protein
VDLFTPIARATDAETSHDGAARIEPKRGTQASQILAMLRAYPKGLTAGEVERYTLIKGSWKRVSDLKNAGLIAPSGETRDGQQVWVALAR